MTIIVATFQSLLLEVVNAQAGKWYDGVTHMSGTKSPHGFVIFVKVNLKLVKMFDINAIGS